MNAGVRFTLKKSILEGNRKLQLLKQVLKLIVLIEWKEGRKTLKGKNQMLKSKKHLIKLLELLTGIETKYQAALEDVLKLYMYNLFLKNIMRIIYNLQVKMIY